MVDRFANAGSCLCCFTPAGAAIENDVSRAFPRVCPDLEMRTVPLLASAGGGSAND